MPANDGVSPVPIPLTQGLIQNKSIMEQPVGSLTVARNFEPAIRGGFRRMNGFEKLVNYPNSPTTSIAPYTRLLKIFKPTHILSCTGANVREAFTTRLTGAITDTSITIPVRDNSLFASSGTLKVGDEEITYASKIGSTAFGSLTRGVNGTVAAAHDSDAVISTDWTTIDNRSVNSVLSQKMDCTIFNFNGTDKILYADGSNNATTYDGTTVVDINGSGAPSQPTYVEVFAKHAFYASVDTQEVIFSAPLDETDFSSGNGAGSFFVPNPIVGMHVFREELYIFCDESIHKLTGTSSSNFTLVDVAKDIGCVSNWTIQELGGDVVFLAVDGIRTIAGTERIGDVELGTISKPIQDVFKDQYKGTHFESVVVHDKTQYRLFFTQEDGVDATTKGVIMYKGEEGYKFTETLGIRPLSCDSFFGNNETKEIVAHGDHDGWVFQQERGNTFNGVNPDAVFRTSDVTLNDAGLRKALDVVHVDIEVEGTLSADMYVRYDYEKPDVIQPAKYPLTTEGIISLYGEAVYGVATYGGQTEIIDRQPVEGSGFAVAISIRDNGESFPYTIKGFQLEARQGARR